MTDTFGWIKKIKNSGHEPTSTEDRIMAGPTGSLQRKPYTGAQGKGGGDRKTNFICSAISPIIDRP